MSDGHFWPGRCPWEVFGKHLSSFNTSKDFQKEKMVIFDISISITSITSITSIRLVSLLCAHLHTSRKPILELKHMTKIIKMFQEKIDSKWFPIKQGSLYYQPKQICRENPPKITIRFLHQRWTSAQNGSHLMIPEKSILGRTKCIEM